MIMTSCKLCFITLALVIFYVNAVFAQLILNKNNISGEWTNDQLQAVGFKMEWTKTEAFMHAYFHLRIAHAYQNELWKKFITVNHRNKDLPDDERCKEFMKCNPIPEFTASHKSALESLFQKLRLDISATYLKVMQRGYMNYIGPLIKKYVKYTSARSPHDFCNDIESPPEKLIFVNEYGQLEKTKNPKYNKPSSSVDQGTQFQFDLNYQFTSSSGIEKSERDFDLNQTPPDDAE